MDDGWFVRKIWTNPKDAVLFEVSENKFQNIVGLFLPQTTIFSCSWSVLSATRRYNYMRKLFVHRICNKIFHMLLFQSMYQNKLLLYVSYYGKDVFRLYEK